MPINFDRSQSGTRVAGVDLTATGEKYVRFTNFCETYGIGPTALATVVQLANEYRSIKLWENKDAIKEKIREILKRVEFTAIMTEESGGILKVTFKTPIDGDHRMHLPIDKF